MKDALGHGSNSHEVIDTHKGSAVVSQHPTFRKAFNASKKHEGTEEMPRGGWRYQIRPIANNASAAASLASGTSKSAPAPTHDAMGGYNEHGSRHGYNPQSTNDAIAAHNRSGRGKIGGREASAIHRLLKGR